MSEGFELGRTYVLEFSEGYLAGAVITMRSASIATVDAIEKNRYSDNLPRFLAHVIEWNLTVDGRPLPVELGAVQQGMEWPVMRRLIGEWYRAATGVSAPLDPPSSDGQPSPDTAELEQSMPMEPSSESPAS